MNELMQSLENRWLSLCETYLPVVHPGQPWRSSRWITERDPDQGWKLHVSTTILDACTVLGTVGPVLRRNGVLFKAPVSLLELKKINTGLHYGYSQIGKCITVYPDRVEDAVRIAQELDQATRGLACPRVPSDLSLREGSCVFYRYGAFRVVHPDHDDKTDHPELASMLRTPSGELVPDRRTRDAAVPSWATDPFLELAFRVSDEDQEATPLMTTYRAYEAISQRGKGGVYKAVDLRSAPARHCVIKEGRKYGETDWDGQDGFTRLRNEKRILERLLAYGARVPNILDYFEVGHSNFLVLQSIDGEVLHSMISGDLVLSTGEVLRYGAKLADVLTRVHSAGVVWRDCKPLNILVDEAHDLTAVDFEGACLVHEAPDQPWGTAGYTPPEWLNEVRPEDLQAQDLYALGATLHHMLSGSPPRSDEALPPIRSLPHKIAPVLVAVVDALTDVVPSSRPSANAVAAALNSALNERQD